MFSTPSLHLVGAFTLLIAPTIAAPASNAPVLNYPKISSNWFELPLDHFNDKDTRTFSNRYWVNDTFYKPGGPVFFYDAGEQGVTDENAAFEIASDGAPTVELAREFNGLAIDWEHRFFGESQPFVLDPDTLKQPAQDATQAYAYHTIEQALEDVKYFANKIDIWGIETGSLHPSKTPWIFIGGSYPGSRAAWARMRDPDTWYAAWASSAPVNPLADGSAYYNNIARSIPNNCSADIAAVTEYIDNALGGSNATLKSSVQDRLYTAKVRSTKGQNNTIDYTEASKTNNTVYGEMLINIRGNFQYNGPAREWKGTLQPFCDDMESWDPADNPDDPFLTSVYTNSDDAKPTDNGVAATHGVDDALNAFLFSYVQMFSGSISDFEPAKPYPVDSPSWSWLVLNEFGVLQASSDNYFKTQTAGSRRFMSKFWDQEAMHAIESFQFVDVQIPESPNTEPLIKNYDGWHMNPSHVMFTAGEHDPWTSYSVMSKEDKLGAPVRNGTTTPPACNKSPADDSYFGIVYPGAVHCSDLKYKQTSKETANSIEMFTSALKVWLPCFKPAS